MIHVGEDDGKIDQAIVQFIHQILRISAGDMKTDIRMFFNKIGSSREFASKGGR